MKIFKFFFSRLFVIALLAIIEIGGVIAIARWFSAQAGWFEGVLRVLAVLISLYIMRFSTHLSSDMMWVILIMLFPIPATFVYFFCGADLVSSKTFRNIRKQEAESWQYLKQDEDVYVNANANETEYRGQFHYLSRSARYPIYENTGFDYYKLGDLGYPVMLEELNKAEKFIFIEYFIIEEGVMWNGILDILEKKVKEGVEVRVLYDDVGSLTTLSGSYAKKLGEKGIQCIPFNRVNPVLGVILNHRDHRKIMVIDGKTAFSGGVNLADEYINVKKIHGHWKDNIIRVTGEAVWSYTVMFLTHWNALSEKKDEDFTVFKAEEPIAGEKDGYIAPYGETPLDTEITAQNVYMGILNEANDYVYIFTPYLIIDTEFINALTLAAKHGIDVRLITPGVPDKKIVWDITRSYYSPLLEGGVRIFEYKPGFVHSKVFVADDKVAAVGTINMDYRSLYLHFENGTYLYGSKKVMDVRDDLLSTMNECEEITPEKIKVNPVMDFIISIIRIFAPMM